MSSNSNIFFEWIFIAFSLANSRGGLFAGATAGSGVGASASLAGDLNNPAGGSLGIGQAEAHAGGIQKEVIKTVSTNVESSVGSDAGTAVVAPVVVEPSALPPQSVSVQTFVAEPNQAVETPDQSDNKYDQAVVVESEQSYNPVQTEQIEQIEQSTQSVVVESTITTTTTTTSPPETTVNNPSGSFVASNFFLIQLFANQITCIYKCVCVRIASDKTKF